MPRTNPFFRQVADNIAASNYHQVFYDQMLGPSVGRVVNDVSADPAAGVIAREEAAETVQEAWEFEQQAPASARHSPRAPQLRR